MLGDAAATGTHDDQALKRLWHYIARFGSLADAFPAPSRPTPHPGPDSSDESKWHDAETSPGSSTCPEARSVTSDRLVIGRAVAVRAETG
jgi:hypothetical protein